jgi:hypothetical protein
MKQYTKPALIDKPLISPTPNSLTELSEYQQKTRWTPGDPLPKTDQPDATRALQRNADAFALHEAERQRKILSFKRKPVPQVIARDGGLEAA